jgi:hypothetical protein
MGMNIVIIQNTVLKLGSGWWGEAGCCEYSNDQSDYIQSEEFID